MVLYCIRRIICCIVFHCRCIVNSAQGLPPPPPVEDFCPLQEWKGTCGVPRCRGYFRIFWSSRFIQWAYSVLIIWCEYCHVALRVALTGDWKPMVGVLWTCVYGVLLQFNYFGYIVVPFHCTGDRNDLRRCSFNQLFWFVYVMQKQSEKVY